VLRSTRWQGGAGEANIKGKTIGYQFLPFWLGAKRDPNRHCSGHALSASASLPLAAVRVDDIQAWLRRSSRCRYFRLHRELRL